MFLDINLDSQGAQTWQTYIQQGLYLDQHTRSLSAGTVVYTHTHTHTHHSWHTAFLESTHALCLRHTRQVRRLACVG